MICGSIWIPLITLAVNWAGVKIYEKLDSEHTQTKKYKITEKTEPSITEVIPQTPTEIPPSNLETTKRAVIVEPLVEKSPHRSIRSDHF